MRAVELYIQLGKRVGATIRQLGYPTKNALKGWYREYQRQLDLPRGYVRSKRKYSQEQKEAAVRHYLDHGRCIAFTMKTLGYPRRQSLAAWIGELHSEAPAPDNLINRDFQAAAPNKKWLTDITEFQVPAGKAYLSPMIDCFDGMIVSWSIGTRPGCCH